MVAPPADRFRYTVKPGGTLTGLAIALGRDVKTMRVRAPGGWPSGRGPAPRDGYQVVPAAGRPVSSGGSPAKPSPVLPPGMGLRWKPCKAPIHSPMRPPCVGGQYRLIPDARSRYRDPEEARIPRTPGNGWRYGDGQFIWPIANGATAITRGFRHMACAWPSTLPPNRVRRSMRPTRATVLTAGWSDNGCRLPQP